MRGSWPSFFPLATTSSPCFLKVRRLSSVTPNHFVLFTVLRPFLSPKSMDRSAGGSCGVKIIHFVLFTSKIAPCRPARSIWACARVWILVVSSRWSAAAVISITSSTKPRLAECGDLSVSCCIVDRGAGRLASPAAGHDLERRVSIRNH